MLAVENMRNLFILDHKNEDALQHLSNVILQNKPKELTETDLAVVMRTFAHFQYVHFDCLELCLKMTIQKASNMDMSSLASITHSLADLSVENENFMSIVRQILLAKIDTKTDIQDIKMLAN